MPSSWGLLFLNIRLVTPNFGRRGRTTATTNNICHPPKPQQRIRGAKPTLHCRPSPRGGAVGGLTWAAALRRFLSYTTTFSLAIAASQEELFRAPQSNSSSSTGTRDSFLVHLSVSMSRSQKPRSAGRPRLKLRASRDRQSRGVHGELGERSRGRGQARRLSRGGREDGGDGLRGRPRLFLTATNKQLVPERGDGTDGTHGNLYQLFLAVNLLPRELCETVTRSRQTGRSVTWGMPVRCLVACLLVALRPFLVICCTCTT